MSGLTDNTNFFQPSGFKVILDRKNYPNFEFFAQSVDHPSISLTATEVATSRIQSVPQPGDALSFDDVNFTIILDEDFNAYTEIFNWMVRLVNTNQTTAYEARTQEGAIPSVCDITVSALTSHNNTNKSFKYVDAFPTSLGNIEFQAQETEYLTVPVTFTFSYFDII